MMREIRTLFTGAILLAGTLALAPVLSQADEIPPPEEDAEPIDENPYARNGFYVGLAGSLGVDTAAEDELQSQLGLRLDVDEAIGMNARVGYRFHPRIAGEFQFEWISDADISIEGVAFGKDAFALERWTYTANAKAYLGTGITQPFLLVGLGLMSVELDGSGIKASDEDFAARFGGGIDIYATDNIIINVDASYVLPAGSLENFDYISVGWGIQYRF